MKRLIFRVLSIATIIISPMIMKAQGTQPLHLTLDQALEIALSENNTIKIADMTVEKTGYARKGSYAALYPNISANGSYQRTLKKQVMVMDMGGQPMEIKVGRDNNISTSATASMPLVNAQLWESLKLSDDMDHFYNQVDENHKNFVSRLLMRCPTLTEREKRLAILIRLGYSSKDIASLMNVEPKTIEISRYRFRRKLKLDRGTNIVQYLQLI